MIRQEQKTGKRILKIVVASPGDVKAERESLEEVVSELNRGIAEDRGLQLELGRWETDAYPGFHPEGPQGLIDPILKIVDCDILIGIFYKRFGTPTGDSKSGTEHEFKTAFEAWKAKGSPQVMVYFNQLASTPKTKVETDQWGLVLEFQENFPKEGLWWPYEGKDDFVKLVRNHLTNFIRAKFPLQRPTPSRGGYEGSATGRGVSGAGAGDSGSPRPGSRCQSPRTGKRIVRAYREAIPRDMPIAWNAVRGQLQLFESLGVRAELARKVIDELDPLFGKCQSGRHSKPVHLVIVVGHRVDEPGRLVPRFPASKEQQAKGVLLGAIRDLYDDEHEMVGLASAASGADILAHEIFVELGIESTICLPMPADGFASLEFKGQDDWRSRFLRLKGDRKLMVLSDRKGLPRWLRGSSLDPWERRNKWVMNVALAWGARRISLIAFWDGMEVGDASSGTAKMVRLAKDTGQVNIVRIDSKQLLASG